MTVAKNYRQKTTKRGKDMMTIYNVRKNEGYEVQFYDRHGNHTHVCQCDNLEEVAKCLIRHCNGNLKGNFPTISLDGKLLRL